MKLIGIKAKIYHKCARKDPKNTKVNFKDLIKRNFYAKKDFRNYLQM
jgi:hypothetical protein